MTTSKYDIIDHPLVFLWLKDLGRHEPLALATILGGNRENFKNFFGQYNQKDMNFDYWIVDYIGIKLIIGSNEIKSVYKISYMGEKNDFIKDKQIGSYIISFLNKMMENYFEQNKK